MEVEQDVTESKKAKVVEEKESESPATTEALAEENLSDNENEEGLQMRHGTHRNECNVSNFGECNYQQ